MRFLDFSGPFPYHRNQDTCVRQPGGSCFLRLSFRELHFIRAGQMWLDSWGAAKPRFIPTFPSRSGENKTTSKGAVYTCLSELGWGKIIFGKCVLLPLTCEYTLECKLVSNICWKSPAFKLLSNAYDFPLLIHLILCKMNVSVSKRTLWKDCAHRWWPMTIFHKLWSSNTGGCQIWNLSLKLDPKLKTWYTEMSSSREWPQ